jgi:hypothetical protein
MSDNILRFVPADPNWQPERKAAEAAASLLKSMLPSAETVSAKFLDSVTFFDPGENWSGVECNACGKDAEAWWGDAIDLAAQKQFTHLTVKAPCCGATVSLNDLLYVWPAAFGRFALEASNPEIADTPKELDQGLAQCLGAPLRKLWQHL